MKIWDKLLKKPKIVAISVILFWLLIVSININRIFNVTDYLEDEATTIFPPRYPESIIGNDIISSYSETSDTFQIVIHNPNGSILTEDIKSTLTQIINNITHNPKIGPYLSAKQPYSSLFDDADNMLRSILALQWFATQMSFASIHYIWGGLNYFSIDWIDRYNITSDVELATELALQQTVNYVEILLNDNNESRYIPQVDEFYNLFSEVFVHEANQSLPATPEDVFSISKTIIDNNETLFSNYAEDARELNLLLDISSKFNGSRWQESDYIFTEITDFLFNVNDTFSIDFVQEVFFNGSIEGYVLAKNNYLLPLLNRDVDIPTVSAEIIEAFLLRYTNFDSSTGETDTTILSFNMIFNQLNEKGRAAYIELMRIIPELQEFYSPLELAVTGLDLYDVELSLDFENQISKTDMIVIITIVVILLLVYRSPILPLIQLVVLAVAFGFSRLIFILMGKYVVGLDPTSLIILSVSLLGATTDYCVFLMGDYLINLKTEKNRLSAIKLTLKRTSKSIIISAISLTIGFGALMFSRFPLAAGMGVGGAIGFLTSMIVSLTLIPAILILIDDKILTKWKLVLRRKKKKKKKFSVIKQVRKAVNNPKKVLIVAAIIVIVATGIFFAIPTDFTQISSAPKSYYSRQGMDVINEHMGPEYTSQIIILFQAPSSDSFLLENQTLNFDSIEILLDIMLKTEKEANVTHIIGLSHPFGRPYNESIENISLFLLEETYILMRNYILPESTLCLVVCGSQYIEGDKNLENQIDSIRNTLKNELDERELTEWNTYVTGFAPIVYDAKLDIKSDFNLIFLFASVAIIVLLLIFLRNVFMSFRVLITIYASLGLSLGIFGLISLIFFGGSIYWVVPLMLYAVLTALGMDFDVLFLGIFLNIKDQFDSAEEALVQSVEQTMHNISVAGIIMAATYLSLIFTSSIHMQQLGLGLGIGILIDVFVSRLFIVPPAVIVTIKSKKETSEIKGEIDEE